MERKSVPRSPQEVLVLCREHDVKAIDLRFTDFPGQWRHKTIPVGLLNEQSFEDGFNFDGASLPGWQNIQESSLLLVPQPETAYIDPFSSLPMLGLICSIQDPITREEFVSDPRQTARRAEYYLASLGIADAAYFGPELQFFVFDSADFGQSRREGHYRVETSQPSGSLTLIGGHLGAALNTGYMHCGPQDSTMDLRCEMMQAMIECGIRVESHHREACLGGQAEIDVEFDSLVNSADNVLLYKHVVKGVAQRRGKTATFMPKPIGHESGSGMHIHFSMWKSGEPLFAGNGYGGLSDTGLYALGGILQHTPALLALTCPTTNSYKRLSDSGLAPIHLSYSQRNRSTACRIPMVSPSPKSKRIEFRCPDSTCNPYLAFAAILMAAIDGVQNKIHPGEPLDLHPYGAERKSLGSVPHVPRSLDAALEALENDHDFLMRGDVFVQESISEWIDYKRRHEVNVVGCLPHPAEFCLYYDC